MPRKILHLDLDAFFCAVEELRDPSLRGKPFAVGGMPNQRGVVASCSYAARQFGVHSAMPTSRALKLCPPLLVISGRHGDYQAASQQVMERLGNLTPLVEQISIDEAFMDVSDLPEPASEIARRLQHAIREELGLPCSIGIASNKLVAKMATDVGKAANRGPYPPFAIQEVPFGQEADFLAPLPIQALWGVGPKTAERLEGLGIHTVGDLTRYSETDLKRMFGKMGIDLYQRARGMDDRPVVISHDVKSISQEITFERDVDDRVVLLRTLRELSEHVGYRLRRDHLAGVTVRLKLRWSDFTTFTRQVRVAQPTSQDGVIYSNIATLFEQIWDGDRKIRLLGVGVSGLSNEMHQLSLWDTSDEKERRLLEAVDALRERFGDQIVQRGDQWIRHSHSGSKNN